MEVHWLPGQEERSGAVEVASIVDQRRGLGWAWVGRIMVVGV